jgi:hypothetical protein
MTARKSPTNPLVLICLLHLGIAYGIMLTDLMTSDESLIA